jgi:Putative O-methyltransferase
MLRWVKKMADFDFSVRPNKSIERKLMLECFLLLTSEFPIRDYRYIGFGSFWFTDFLLFHKRLGIRKMVSIERPKYSTRAEFNSPHKCISVVAGESTLVLPSVPFQRNGLLWLDYDKGLDGPWRDDAEIVLQQMKPGGIFTVTVNSEKRQVTNQIDEDGDQITQLEALEGLVGDLVPPGTTSTGITLSTFPVIVGEILTNAFRRIVRKADPKLEFEPLFNFCYADNATMVTVGGMVVDAESRHRLTNCNLDSLEFLTGATQCRIDAPPLTLKEKQALDRKLPKSTPLSSTELPAKLRSGLKMREVHGYQKFYQYYPVFAELQE